jgi:DNA polymerase III sliding clamp (beta) subunit (PCNA family)
MMIKVNLEVDDKDIFIIPSRAFDLIRNLPDGEVEITVDNKYAITIKAKGINNKFQSFDPETFVMMNTTVHEADDISIDSAKFMDAVGKVMYAVSSNNTNQIMGSLYMEAAGGSLNMVGLDGHRISWNQMKYDKEFSLLIPKSAMEKLISLDIKGNLTISFDKFSAIFTTDEYEVHTRLTAGEFYKYTQLFQEAPNSTIVYRKELLDALHRASICADKEGTDQLR